eukprot:TRINITY_DN5845_c0_g3_i1.p1 TRINITY_DN5845_c0_g3~~TRINITY_DN5845_c0_g3_i1.p1  ORF type:complete len:680 (+),score=171.10 TRINITY_DN5845_c0_g3_i1:100-2139(+)
MAAAATGILHAERAHAHISHAVEAWGSQGRASHGSVDIPLMIIPEHSESAGDLVPVRISPRNQRLKLTEVHLHHIGAVASLFVSKEGGLDNTTPETFTSFVDGEQRPKVFGPPESVGRDWVLRRQKRVLVFKRFVVIILHLCLLGVQNAGVLGFGDHEAFLVEGGEPMSDDSYGPFLTSYHVLVTLMFLLGLWQVVLNYDLYTYERKLMVVNDPLWDTVPLLQTPVRLVFLMDVCLALLLEPPGLALVYDEAFKLNILIFCRVPLAAVRVIRQFSWTNRQPARVAGWVAGIQLGPLFQLKAYAARQPRLFISCVLISGWFLLSLTMTIAESRQQLDFQDAAWLVFITMTTVGYGDLAPQSTAGKVIASLSACFGLIVTAMLINITTHAMQLTQEQRQVLDFMTAAQQHRQIEEMAARIVLQTFRAKATARRGPPQACRAEFTRLAVICARFRAARRAFHKMVERFHAIDPSNYSLGNKIRDMDVMISSLFESHFPDGRDLLLPKNRPPSVANTTPRPNNLSRRVSCSTNKLGRPARRHPLRANLTRQRDDPLVDLSPAPSFNRPVARSKPSIRDAPNLLAVPSALSGRTFDVQPVATPTVDSATSVTTAPASTPARCSTDAHIQRVLLELHELRAGHKSLEEEVRRNWVVQQQQNARISDKLDVLLSALRPDSPDSQPA